MITLYYNKQNNSVLFEKSSQLVNIENIQNYIPLYDKYFSLTTENYNSINLNHKYFITYILEKNICCSNIRGLYIILGLI